jgi:anti-sigma B factor antagonist
MLVGFMSGLPLAAQRRQRFLVAVSEAFTNAAVHGAPPIALVVELRGKTLSVICTDGAHWCSPVTPHDDPLAESGRGIELMQRLADRLKIEHLPSGTSVTLEIDCDYARSEQKCDSEPNIQRVVADKNPQETYMKVDVKRDGQTALLKLRGRLDLESSSVVKEEIRRCLGQGFVGLILDLEAVEFINSSGLGAMVSALKEIRLAKARLVVCKLAPYVREIFEITQLSHIFEIYSTEGEAREALTAVRAPVRA